MTASGPQEWAAVDERLAVFAREDAALAAARTSTEVASPGIEVSRQFGRLLHTLAVAAGARRVLEFGTLAGYSTIWLARAVGPTGRVCSIEVNRDHAAVARRHLEAAGVSAWVDIHCGPAADVSARMVAAGVEPFDLVFIDADKANLPTYVERALELTRPGALIVVDNVVRGGRILDPGDDPQVRGVVDALAALQGDDRVQVSITQTVGEKGWDGFALLRRVG
ncbi:MAG: O-methyltransferase [Propionibacteriaceae bacterium]|nr:O-methyltransferase [Propionibacteriaceae bacterium]